MNKVGHKVTVYERADRIGGLLMYGIPNMKLDKGVVDRRVDLLRREGIEFVTCTHVGKQEAFEPGQMTQIMRDRGCEIQFIDPEQLLDEHDALLLATGATRPFDPMARCPGRELQGIHQAMEYLTHNTKSLLDSRLEKEDYSSARGRDVIVIGGGDTGADCIGTSLRHGCKSLVNFELLDKPPAERATDNPWPEWPRIARVDYSHEESTARFGKDPRTYTILTKAFIDDGQGNVKAVQTVQIDWSKPTDGGPPWQEIAGTEKEWPAELVLFATGFVGPEKTVGAMLGLEMQNPQGNWETFKAEHGEFATNVDRVFVAGDCRRGQSLVVWAINEGRGAARAIDQALQGSSTLPAPGVTLEASLAAGGS